MSEKNFDVSNLRRVILSTSGQFKEGFAIAKDISVNDDFDHVVVSGMGGSALPVDVIACYLEEYFSQNPQKGSVSISHNRNYTLPRRSYDRALNIFCSHSGNTEETIASLEEAIAHGLQSIGISAGGRVKEICQEKNIPHITLPIPFENFQPRMATGHFFSTILQILINAKKIDDVSSVISEKTASQIQNDVVVYEMIGKNFAQKLVGKTPIIYASEKFASLAMIWKIKINENSKVPAFWNVFPELNHNEFVGFTNPQAQFHVMILRDSDDHERIMRRFAVTAEALIERDIEVDIVDIAEGDMIRKIFSTIALCDWISYYLALNYHQDPTPVDMVENFKKALG